jgi:protein involved in ribonucleotide reduction
MGQSCSVVDSNSNRKFISSISTKATSAFNDPKVEKTMFTIHDKYVIVCNQYSKGRLQSSSFMERPKDDKTIMLLSVIPSFDIVVAGIIM